MATKYVVEAQTDEYGYAYYPGSKEGDKVYAMEPTPDWTGVEWSTDPMKRFQWDCLYDAACALAELDMSGIDLRSVLIKAEEGEDEP